jgi:hypothetical protein
MFSPDSEKQAAREEPMGPVSTPLPPDAMRDEVFRAQDRARMKALEEAQLEKYMSWSDR